MSVKLYLGKPGIISFSFKENPLTSYNTSYADVENVYFGLKINTAKDLDDQFLAKYQSDGSVLLDTVGHKIIVTIKPEDYVKLRAGIYKIVLGIKVSQYNQYIELSIEDDSVVIENDKIRN